MNKIAIAQIVKPQGIKGEVKARILTSDTKNLNKYTEFFIDNISYKLQSYSVRENFLYIKLDTITNRNQAELLRNKKIFVSREDLTNKLADDEYIIDEILGFELKLEESEEVIGYLQDVQNYGSADVFYCINGTKEFSFARVVGVITNVDFNKKTIMLNNKKLQEVVVYED